MIKPKLIIMVGNIVSGKSTWIKQNRMIERGFVVLSKDDLRRMFGAGKYLWSKNIEPIVQTSFIDLLQNFMVNDINIILDETNMDVETRKAYFHLTRKKKSYGYDYETIAVVMPYLSKEKMKARIGCRIGKPKWGSFSREVWEGVWQRKNDKFQMPTEEEGFDEIWEI